MRKQRMISCKTAALVMVASAVLLDAYRAEAAPVMTPTALAAAMQQVRPSHRVPYVCRRDAYGRTCTYVSPERNLRSDRPHYNGAYPYYSAQPNGGYSGYYPFYWANPQ